MTSQDRHDSVLVVGKSGFGSALRFWILTIRLDHLTPYCHQQEVFLRFRMDSFVRDSMSSMKFARRFNPFVHWIFAIGFRRVLRCVSMGTLLSDVRNRASLQFGLRVDGLINEVSASFRHSLRGTRKSRCHTQTALGKCVVWHQVQQHQHLRPSSCRE